MTHDIFQHDDGVIDDEAGGERDGEQRHVVDRIAEHRHNGAGRDQRHGQRQHRDERGTH